LHKIEGALKRSVLTSEHFVEVATRVLACNSFHLPTQTIRPLITPAFQSVMAAEKDLLCSPTTLPLPSIENRVATPSSNPTPKPNDPEIIGWKNELTNTRSITDSDPKLLVGITAPSENSTVSLSTTNTNVHPTILVKKNKKNRDENCNEEHQVVRKKQLTITSFFTPRLAPLPPLCKEPFAKSFTLQPRRAVTSEEFCNDDYKWVSPDHDEQPMLKDSQSILPTILQSDPLSVTNGIQILDNGGITSIPSTMECSFKTIEQGTTCRDNDELAEYLHLENCKRGINKSWSKAMDDNRFLLINIQQKNDQCRDLNRDVWNNKTVKDVISQHFVFWQEVCTVLMSHVYVYLFSL
jgi:hypothetical protein